HWEESEVPAAADGEIHAQQARGPDGKFDQTRAAGAQDVVLKTGRLGIAVTVVPDRVATGVVAKPLGQQDLVRPRLCPWNGEVGRAVADDGLAGSVLEHGLRAAHVGTELPRRLARDELVAVAVTCDLVPLASDLADEIGMMSGDLAQDKEGRSRSAGRQQREHALRAGFDATLESDLHSVHSRFGHPGMERFLDVPAC